MEEKKDLADRTDDLLASLRKAQQVAESAWTPGEALGEIIAHLARVESFSGTAVTAEHVRARTRQLAERLRAAARRAEAAGLGLNLGGVFGALEWHDLMLERERTVQTPSVRAARDLVRLEISWLMPPAVNGDLTA